MVFGGLRLALPGQALGAELCSGWAVRLPSLQTGAPGTGRCWGTALALVALCSEPVWPVPSSGGEHWAASQHR